MSFRGGGIIPQVIYCTTLFVAIGITRKIFLKFTFRFEDKYGNCSFFKLLEIMGRVSVFLTVFLINVHSIFSMPMDIQSVTLFTSNEDVFLRVKTRGLYLDLTCINISYNHLGNSVHKIDLIFDGCALPNAIKEFDTTFQIDSAIPFDLALYTIWDTTDNCGYFDDPLIADSLFLTFDELLSSMNPTLGYISSNPFPNPSSDLFCVNFSFDSCRVIDTKAHILVAKFAKNNCIDLSDLPSGVYFLEFYINESRQKFRVLKE